VLDSVLLAYRLGEDRRVRLPVIVNLDGFTLSFTREPVEIPDATRVAGFLPVFDPQGIRFRASQPSSQAVAVLGGTPYSYFRYETHLAALNALPVYDEIAHAFERSFGRAHPALEAYRTDDAEVVFFMMGAFATKAKAAVDALREAGERVGLLRLRLLRPFPEAQLRALLAGKRGVAVIDQNLSMGKGGVLHSELGSVLYGHPGAPPIIASFIGGLGGRDISAEEFYEIAKQMRQAAATGNTPEPRLLYTQNELRQFRKLQAIAVVERQDLGGGTA
jgi:pyruvate ferredoxin oxidoreductase alpha subunit